MGTKTQAGSTHFTEGKKPEGMDESTQKALNHDTPDELIDPPEDIPGSTHTSVEASTTAAPATVVKADVEETEVPAEDTTVSEETVTEDEPEESIFDQAQEDASDTEEDVIAALEDELDFADDGGAVEMNAIADTQHTSNETPTPALDVAEVGVENNEMPDGIVVASDASEDEGWEDEDDISGDAAIEDDMETPETADMADEEEEDEEPASEAGGEELPLVDVDGVDDEADKVVIASLGTKLLAIRGSRIVATMNKKQATIAGHLDVYLSEQFEQVVASDMAKKGMRKGLTGLGFTLAKVNVASAETVNARVAKQVQAGTAAVRRVTAAKEKVFQDSLAIAAVGLNRGRFKDVENPLKAALIAELQTAGVRNSSRLVHNVFAQYGIDYAKTLCEVANKLASAPQETRTSLTASFDMTNEVDEDEDEYGEEDAPDAEFADEFEEDIEHPNSVQASLSVSGVRSKAALLTAKQVGYSTTASDVLAGRKPLPFA